MEPTIEINSEALSALSISDLISMSEKERKDYFTFYGNESAEISLAISEACEEEYIKRRSNIFTF